MIQRGHVKSTEDARVPGADWGRSCFPTTRARRGECRVPAYDKCWNSGKVVPIDIAFRRSCRRSERGGVRGTEVMRYNCRFRTTGILLGCEDWLAEAETVSRLLWEWAGSSPRLGTNVAAETGISSTCETRRSVAGLPPFQLGTLNRHTTHPNQSDKMRVSGNLTPIPSIKLLQR